MTVAGSIKAQLDEAAHVIREQMARIADLEAEVERLKAGLGAHEYLQSVWRNPTSSEGNRIKAATAALPHETPRLESVPPPLDLTAEEVVVPLAEVIRLQRARADKLLLEPPYRVVNGQKPNGNGRHRNGNGGNGSSSDDSSSD
jgi:hypothetical protein